MGVTDVEERFTAGRAHPAVLSVFGAEGVTPNTEEHQTWREITLVSLGIPLPDLLSLKGIEMYAEEVLRAREDGTSVSAEPRRSSRFGTPSTCSRATYGGSRPLTLHSRK